MEASPCPLEVEFSNQIAALLAPPSSKSIQEYYDGLLHETKSHFIRVEFNENGKGVFSNRDFKEEHLVLKDQMLVAAQHSSNKVDCFVCSRCFCYIGSVEIQIGRKLYLESLGLTTMDCDHQSEDQSFLQENDDETGSSAHKNNSFSMDVLHLLMDGNLFLPYSKQFTLPTIVACPGGCEEEHYCSKLCADIDWDTVHSLLCTGKTSDSFRRAALVKFTEHANRTNDIFILAAKVISFTILRYRRLKRSYIEGSKQPILNEAEGQSNLCIFLEAWKPVAMGFKRRWWDCIALPDDIGSCQEASFRMQIRDLAFTSLQLLKEAIFDVECAPLFSLEIYGNIIGMFELNNLDLVVASPVEDYFIYIDNLSSPEKEEAERTTKPFLDALGGDYSICCQGTAFYPIQSCMNHSCCPNAKAFKREEDRDGQAVILALRPISVGEEITISYIDEDLPYEERRALLADYGFKCCCPKCTEQQSLRT